MDINIIQSHREVLQKLIYIKKKTKNRIKHSTSSHNIFLPTTPHTFNPPKNLKHQRLSARGKLELPTSQKITIRYRHISRFHTHLTVFGSIYRTHGDMRILVSLACYRPVHGGIIFDRDRYELIAPINAISPRRL